MNISIMDVVGPVMVGPSSSHTAGAARLARCAGLLAGEGIVHASFGLHGSFAKTGRGHGTDRALVAGILGMREDDERLAQSFEIAEKRGLTFDFYETELENAHENTAKITLTMADDTTHEIVGASIGGGQIRIHELDGMETDMGLDNSTIVVEQYDKKGIISGLSSILKKYEINIAAMSVKRVAKGDIACCVIETDGWIPPEIEDEMRSVENVINVRVINVGSA